MSLWLPFPSRYREKKHFHLRIFFRTIHRSMFMNPYCKFKKKKLRYMLILRVLFFHFVDDNDDDDVDDDDNQFTFEKF